MKPNEPNASFSDLLLVRRLSQALRAGPRGSATPAQDGYVHLSEEMDARPPPPAAAAPPTVPDPPRPAAGPASAPAQAPEEGFGSRAWDELLDRCCRVAGAGGALVMDAAGLLVTARGELVPEQAEALGARLVVALDQADQLSEGSGARSAALALASGWASAFPLRRGGERLTVGLLHAEPFDEPVRRTVAGLVAQAED